VKCLSPKALASPGQLLLTLDAAEIRAQLAHTREEQLAAQEHRRIAIAGGNAEELARLEGDLHRTDAELVKLGRDRDSQRRPVEKQAATPDELAQVALALERATAERQFFVRKCGDLQQPWQRVPCDEHGLPSSTDPSSGSSMIALTRT
jgi:hypothetical protein